MDSYEYKVIPAPEKGLKAKGIKRPEARFAHAVELAMNELGAQGWEYWRAEALPSTERAGLTGSRVTERHLLVFRRPLETKQELAQTARPVGAAAPLSAVPEQTREPVFDRTPEPQIAEAQEPMEDGSQQPVFTRRIELARESRQAALQKSGLSAAPETREGD